MQRILRRAAGITQRLLRVSERSQQPGYCDRRRWLQQVDIDARPGRRFAIGIGILLLHLARPDIILTAELEAGFCCRRLCRVKIQANQRWHLDLLYHRRLILRSQSRDFQVAEFAGQVNAEAQHEQGRSQYEDSNNAIEARFVLILYHARTALAERARRPRGFWRYGSIRGLALTGWQGAGERRVRLLRWRRIDRVLDLHLRAVG